MNYHERTKEFYNGKEWKELRRQRMEKSNWLCEECKKKGIVRKAREVHHIIPIEEDWSKRYEYNNLTALCPECHNEKHERISELERFDREWLKIEMEEK